MKRRITLAALAAAAALASAGAGAEEIGSVDTAFKLIGPNHKIVIEAFDDPKVEGVACHISKAKTGGIKGGLGLAEDTSDASIACRQIGPIGFRKPIKDGEEVFEESRSILFKRLRVVRFFDKKRNTLVYLVYSDKLIDGSPQNAISTVPIMPWAKDSATEPPKSAPPS
jgi:CreA protein